MAYYTGILFEGFVQRLGFAVASGGRYDNLIAHFGRAMPAVGFAIGVERVMMLQNARVSIAPAVIAQVYNRQVEQARTDGRVIEIDVLHRDAESLREYARIRGAGEIWWRDGKKEILDADEC